MPARPSALDASTLDNRQRRSGKLREPTIVPVFIGGEGVVQNRIVRLSEAEIVIGRNPPPSGIALPNDAHASRHHAAVRWDEAARVLSVEDLKSRNGVRLNGASVERAELADGDVLRAGSSFFIVRYEDPSEIDVPSATILGQAPSARVMRVAAVRLARSRSSVLLQGETGTGKEVVARAIHAASGRAGAFVAINCAAITESLAESVLFGHVAGAFTGAQRDQPGLLRSAHKGTLFLDEIGDMPISMQPKLLRALESGAVTPVGSTTPAAFDARCIAATHVDLDKAVERGTFRADLAARIGHHRVPLPPLRERREDILLLLEKHLTAEGAEAAPSLDPDLVEALLCHDWPQNIRELIAVGAELSVWGAGAETLLVEHARGRVLPPEEQPSASDSEAPRPSSDPAGAKTDDSAKRPRSVVSKDELARLLQVHDGNVAAVAKEVGRSRMQVYRWMEQYKLPRR